MWRYPFLNLCFVVLVITLLAVQHSVTVFGPTGHAGASGASEQSGRFDFMSDGKLPRSLPAPANVSRAAALLDDIWHRGVIFNEWLMEYNTSRWEIFRASSPAETDLIEARFRVANAEVFTDGLSEHDRAVQELARAERSLQAAQTIVTANLRPRLTTIREEIAAAEISEHTEGDFSIIPFETIKANLDYLIEVARSSKDGY
jgi:hypothetical protein